MKLAFLLFISSAIFFLKNDNSASGDELHWSKTRKLIWSDFKGKPFDSSAFSAASSVKLKLRYEIIKKTISVQLFCFFDKKESWYRDTNSYVLNHEQIHFDIGELVIRMMRKQIDSLSKAKEKLNIKAIERMINSYSDKLKEMQHLYDEETNHSINFGAQIRWNNLIYDELEKLKEFEDPYKEYFIRKGKMSSSL